MLQVTVLPFPLAAPDQIVVSQVQFTLPASASYTVAITADPGSVFTVTGLSAVRPTTEIVPLGGGDPGDGVKGHPHKGTVVVDVPVGATNGVLPLNVLSGDQLTATVQSRGRDRPFGRPPAQIPACGIPALGSCLRSERQSVPPGRGAEFGLVEANAAQGVPCAPSSGDASGCGAGAP